MSDTITLTLRTTIDAAADVEGLTADRLAMLSNQEIGRHPMRIGARAAMVGDLFKVDGERSMQLRIEGSLSRFQGVGAGMRGGELIVDGDVGDRLGAHMAGGAIEVRGAAGDEAGLAMKGGTIRISGDAGNRVGAPSQGASKGMSGGEIVIDGCAGAGVGMRIRRGLIAIGGDVGDEAGASMIAGTILAVGNVGANPGRLNRRGSIVAVGAIEVPVTYRYACTFQPPHLRLLVTYLQRRYGFRFDDAALPGRYRRYCGDAGGPGKGEILALVRS
jgi:formylmethanofuran dehydrogenase subunit C